ARPKAVIAMDDRGNVMSGQTDIPKGYDYWILKFDGVTDLELGEPKGYGRIEYAYYLMARAAGIEMEECRLLEENNRAHFLTRRFDRENHEKIHMQSLCGMAHFDFNRPGAYSYEQAFSIMRQLRLSKPDAIEQYRRMVFNVVARNQDDHTKNIAFLMDRQGRWKLSPAFDVIYSHNPAGKWTNQHQMSINGKRDHFTTADLILVG
ncbi:MAG: HipA domain-containing protein, partial [Deltaproteobacteria bacterium]|nr:HipA domain-containing protein [Deltaproteobacteria bacterium]